MPLKSGKLGSADLAAGVDTLLVPVASADATSVSLNLRLTNRNATPVKVRVAIGSGANPAGADYIEYDCTVPANTPLENTALVLSPNEKVWVRSDTVNVSARAHGYEE